MVKDHYTFVLDGNLTSYFPGETISGQFRAELASPVNVKEIRICLYGSSYCEFTETIDESESTYCDQETFVNLTHTCVTAENMELSAGHHQYSFSFTLPHGIPSSIETSQAYVRYRLTAVFELAGSLGNRLESCIINVVSPFDLNGVRDENFMLPSEFTYEKTNCCLCCESGPITATIKTDRMGYVPGDHVIIHAEINNMSNSSIKGSVCKLIMRYIVYAGGSQSFFTVPLGEIKHGPIEKGGTDVYRHEKILVPPVPPSQLSGCKIIKIVYVVQDRRRHSAVVARRTIVQKVPDSIPVTNSSRLFVSQQCVETVDLCGIAAGAYSDPCRCIRTDDIMDTNNNRQFTAGQHSLSVWDISTDISTLSYRNDLLNKISEVSLRDCIFGGVNIIAGEDPLDSIKRMREETAFVPKYLYYRWNQRNPADLFTVQKSQA